MAKLGIVALEEARYDEAVGLLEQSTQQLTAVGDRWNKSWILEALGRAALGQGQLSRAREVLYEGLRTQVQFNATPGMCYQLESCGVLEIMAGQHERGLRMIAAVHAFFTHNARAVQSQRQLERALEHVRAALDQRTFQRVWEAGAALTLTEAIAFALAGRS